MLPEGQNFKESFPEKEQTRKMILMAKDYVHFLRGINSATKDIPSEDDSDPELNQSNGIVVELPKLSHILASLRDDLRCSTSIFLEEFISCGGVECLLDALRKCQSKQNSSSVPVTGRQQHTVLRKMLVNQNDCLLCLKYLVKNPKSVIRMTDHPQGLSSIASCFMSSYCKSRVFALELLTRVLDISSRGHALVLEALTAIRVVFAEPIRFKFLVGMLNGNTVSTNGFQETGLKFLNTLLRTSPRPADRVRLQCELEEAGLNIGDIEMSLSTKGVLKTSPVWEQIEIWRYTYLDVENLNSNRQSLETENVKLYNEVQLLRKALQKLEEDKINLMHIEMELKEKCEDLHEEMTTLKTEMRQTQSSSEESDFSRVYMSGTNDDRKHHRSFMEDDLDEDRFPDSGQLETEEIIIDVPTIRPPEGFRSDNATELNMSMTSKPNSTIDVIPIGTKESIVVMTSSEGLRTKVETNSSDKDSALSESESDSGINWQYPVILDTASDLRRSRSRLPEDDPNRYFQFSGLYGSRRIQRSQSEDRREMTEARKRRHLLDNNAKVVESTGFMLVRQPQSDPIARHESLPPRAQLEPTQYTRVSGKTYPLPVAYRNNFLLRGHSNCDLYSGVSQGKNESSAPPIPPPDYSRSSTINPGGTISSLVHREITKAVRQISGWI